VNNNAFTNHLVRWHLRAAATLAADLKAAGRWAALQAALDLTDDEIARWVAIADTMYDGFLPELGFHEQFEGHRLLPERAIDRSLSRMAYTGPVQHSFKPTKVAQQADTVLMYWMFFEDYAPDVMRKAYEYYEPRCSHTSSLSRCIYSALAARLGMGDEAYRQFLLSAENDITPGKEMESESGVHAACMGGTWLAVVTGFAGVWVRRGRLELDPHLPAAWKSLRLTLAWRGSALELTVFPDRVRLRTRGGTIPVTVRGREVAATPAPMEVAL
jgi:trehalose/maltose hydrolase-like predicted phosphorylase